MSGPQPAAVEPCERGMPRAAAVGCYFEHDLFSPLSWAIFLVPGEAEVCGSDLALFLIAFCVRIFSWSYEAEVRGLSLHVGAREGRVSRVRGGAGQIVRTEPDDSLGHSCGGRCISCTATVNVRKMARC